MPKNSEVELIDLQGTPLDGLMESADPNVRVAFERLKGTIGGVNVYHFLRDIATLGKFARNVGIRDMIRGSAVVVQAKMFIGVNLMEDNLKIYEGKDTAAAWKQRRQIMETMKGFCDIINKSQDIMLKTEGSLAGLSPINADPAEPTRQSFAPGQEVKPVAITAPQPDPHNPAE